VGTLEAGVAQDLGGVVRLAVLDQVVVRLPDLIVVEVYTAATPNPSARSVGTAVRTAADSLKRTVLGGPSLASIQVCSCRVASALAAVRLRSVTRTHPTSISLALTKRPRGVSRTVVLPRLALIVMLMSSVIVGFPSSRRPKP
jgi:hypothetical protein